MPGQDKNLENKKKKKKRVLAALDLTAFLKIVGCSLLSRVFKEKENRVSDEQPSICFSSWCLCWHSEDSSEACSESLEFK